MRALGRFAETLLGVPTRRNQVVQYPDGVVFGHIHGPCRPPANAICVTPAHPLLARMVMADKTKASTARGKQIRRASGQAEPQEGGKDKNRAKDSKDKARRR
jgi:hypothetical protein